MPPLTCNACNKEFQDDVELRLHYRSDWHRYNLKRKVAGVPGVTEALFETRQAALNQDKEKSQDDSLSYSCGLCGKNYRSAKAHAQHLSSRNHIARASSSPNDPNDIPIVKPIVRRVVDRHSNEEDSDEEWEEVSENEADVMEEDTDDFSIDPSCCFMCDEEHDTIENCMTHMHSHHGFFIPDIEYLKDAKGLLTYVGLKVKRDFKCLYCNDKCLPFGSLEAVRKHMEAKSHCKVHYGDGTDDEEAELEEFYDYSSSYVDKQMVLSGDETPRLISSGSELVLTNRSSTSVSTKILGSREFLRYYKQKPRPSQVNGEAISAVIAARYKSMGLATVQSKDHIVRMKVMKEMSRSGVEVMRSKIALKNNVIRNLPKNVPY